MSKNVLKTINEKARATIKEQRSEFICILYPVDSAERVKELIGSHNDEFKNATHNCYAYVLGKKQEIQYYSDQGEPSGTAGKPILNTLLKHSLTNVLAIVTCYYGGIKLGVRGLRDAYSKATEEALINCELKDFIQSSIITVKCDYSFLETLKHLLRQIPAELIPEGFTEKIKAKIVYPQDNEEQIKSLITDLTSRELLTIINLE